MLGGAERPKRFDVDRDVEVHSPTSPWSPRERLAEIIDEVRTLRAEPPAARHAAWIRELALGADDDGRGVIEAAL